jgi:hypothetical protein
VEAGANVVEVRWRSTWDQYAGIWVSLGTLALMLAWGWIAGRRPGKGDDPNNRVDTQ